VDIFIRHISFCVLWDAKGSLSQRSALSPLLFIPLSYKMVLLCKVIDHFYYYFAMDILMNQWLPF
jgi:hypothetical protein